MNTCLLKKKTFIISPFFFDYHITIKNALEDLGYITTLYNERPDDSLITKALIRLGVKNVISNRIGDHYSKILNDIRKNTPDSILIISPETIPPSFINDIRKYYPNIKIFTYFWDSLKNKSGARYLVDISDKAYSFDDGDCKANHNLHFLPLFYTEDYHAISDCKEYSIDILFIGTIHSDRWLIAKQIEEQSKHLGLKFCMKIYCPHPFIFIFKKIFSKNYRGLKYKDVQFKKISTPEVISLVKKSKALLDIHHPNQNGLTMRTLEALGSNRKLITTNKSIKNYPFYNDIYHHIIDRKNPKIKKDFFLEIEKKEKTINHNDLHIKNWLNKIFNS